MRVSSLRRSQGGATILEVLVSVLVLSLGIFGMVGLQLRALKGNNSSFQRTQAVMMSYYIVDAMKVDDMLTKLSSLRAASFEPGTHATLKAVKLNASCGSSSQTFRA